MTALYRTASRIDRRCKYLLHSEEIKSDQRSEDVNHAIYSAKLMQMHRFKAFAVHLCLCLKKSLENLQALTPYFLLEFRFIDDSLYILPLQRRDLIPFIKHHINLRGCNA